MQTAPPIFMLQERPAHRALSALAPGEFTYLAPSALVLTSQRQFLLRADAPTRCAPDAMFSLHVRRTAIAYVADITQCSYQWVPTNRCDETRCVPVERLVFADEALY